jgi:hypothetical protein
VPALSIQKFPDRIVIEKKWRGRAYIPLFFTGIFLLPILGEIFEGGKFASGGSKAVVGFFVLFAVWTLVILFGKTKLTLNQAEFVSRDSLTLLRLHIARKDLKRFECTKKVEIGSDNNSDPSYVYHLVAIENHDESWNLFHSDDEDEVIEAKKTLNEFLFRKK